MAMQRRGIAIAIGLTSSLTIALIQLSNGISLGRMPPPAAFALTSPKTEYGIGESIVITASLTNTSSSPLRLLRTDLDTVTISVSRDGRRVRPYKSTAHLELDSEFARDSQFAVQLAPNETISFQLRIWQLPSQDQSEAVTTIRAVRGGHEFKQYPIASPGTYRIRATYKIPTRPRQEDATLLLKGLRSNALTFKRQ